MCISVGIALRALEFLVVSMSAHRVPSAASEAAIATAFPHLDNRGLASLTPRSSLGGAAEHGPTTGTEGVEISHHAGGDLILVRNVIAAQPPCLILARGPLLRRSLRGAGRRRKHGHRPEHSRHGKAKDKLSRRAAVVDVHIDSPFAY
jgi:hypothetical protein